MEWKKTLVKFTRDHREEGVNHFPINAAHYT